MSAYTKGPWESASREGDFWDSVVYLPQRMGHEVCQCFHERGNESECEANARLISAAPDLLESLKAMVFVYADQERGYDYFLGKHIPTVLEAAKEAIAKAEGK